MIKLFGYLDINLEELTQEEDEYEYRAPKQYVCKLFKLSYYNCICFLEQKQKCICKYLNLYFPFDKFTFDKNMKKHASFWMQLTSHFASYSAHNHPIRNDAYTQRMRQIH